MMKVRIAEVKRFITECLRAVGANMNAAEQQASLLTYADKIGHRNYGLRQLGMLIGDIRNGSCEPNNMPVIVSEKSSIAWIDTKNVMGATAGCFAMDVAVKKAFETGVGWIAISGSCNNCKPYSFWTQKAAEAGLIGMVFASSALETKREEMVEQRAFQNNANQDLISEKTFETPSSGGSFASTKVAAMVDFISGTGTMNMTDKDSPCTPALVEPSNNTAAHCFVVVNPACFTIGFENKFTDDLPYQNKKSMNHDLLEVPLGHLEKKTSINIDDTHSIHYELHEIQSNASLAKELNVKPIKFIEMASQL